MATEGQKDKHKRGTHSHTQPHAATAARLPASVATHVNADGSSSPPAAPPSPWACIANREWRQQQQQQQQQQLLAPPLSHSLALVASASSPTHSPISITGRRSARSPVPRSHSIAQYIKSLTFVYRYVCKVVPVLIVSPKLRLWVLASNTGYFPGIAHI
jgi:hypothetical protein